MNLGSYRNTHDFMNPSVTMPTSTFNRPSQLKTAFNVGELIPIFSEEVLPGDTHQLTTASFGRFATLIRPILDNVYLDIHYFFVPNRIMWSEWERFQGGDEFTVANYIPQQAGDGIFNTCQPPEHEFVPVIKPSDRDGKGFKPDSLADYLGIPTLIPDPDKNQAVNCFYHRAYNKIYFDWYMDQNIRSSLQREDDRSDVMVQTDSRIMYDDLHYPIRKRCKRRDYFTSCLPWSQKGNPVTIPLGGRLPVHGMYSSLVSVDKTDLAGNPTKDQYEFGDNRKIYPDNSKLNAPISSTTKKVVQGATGYIDQNNPFSYEYDPATKQFKAPYVDLGSNTAITVNQLREALAIQRLLEKDARGGTRYVEIIKNHFGVTSPDYRLQRSEFLGSSTQLLNTTAVPQTSSTDAKSPQAHLSSYGTSSNSKMAFKKTFTEHGVILGIASARVDQTYQNGLERRFSRSDRYDYYMPALAHLGEQPVLYKEIFFQNKPSSGGARFADNDVFGYIPRWDEYRFKQSHVTGAMRSNYPTGSLDSWHLANNFTQIPVLNLQFMFENPPIDRVVAVPTEKHFVFDFYFDLVSTRVMPITSVPSIVQKL